MNMTPVQRLIAAYVCKEEDLNDQEKAKLNKLSTEEVDHFINLHKKLAPAESDAGRANFPV